MLTYVLAQKAMYECLGRREAIVLSTFCYVDEESAQEEGKALVKWRRDIDVPHHARRAQILMDEIDSTAWQVRDPKRYQVLSRCNDIRALGKVLGMLLQYQVSQYNRRQIGAGKHLPPFLG